MKSKFKNNDQNTNGILSILNSPFIYTKFERIMGSMTKYKMLINEFMKPRPFSRILDIGCGTADILNLLPSTIDYVGYDLSSKYINFAKKKYGERAKFFHKCVSDITIGNNSFDIVFADGLIHHLNDIEAMKLFEIGYEALDDIGIMLTTDPTYAEGQSFIDKYITSKDRGQHIRTPSDYKIIAETRFPKVKAEVTQVKKIFTLTGCVLQCYKI